MAGQGLREWWWGGIAGQSTQARCPGSGGAALLDPSASRPGPRSPRLGPAGDGLERPSNGESSRFRCRLGLLGRTALGPLAAPLPGGIFVAPLALELHGHGEALFSSPGRGESYSSGDRSRRAWIRREEGSTGRPKFVKIPPAAVPRVRLSRTSSASDLAHFLGGEARPGGGLFRPAQRRVEGGRERRGVSQFAQSVVPLALRSLSDGG